jgi:hypothetical protein
MGESDLQWKIALIGQFYNSRLSFIRNAGKYVRFGDFEYI